VPADPPGAAPATVEKALGRPVNEAFASFDPEPFASGSVAQVHRARLHDGSPVAVKVLHDGATQRVDEDLDLMAAVASLIEEKDDELARLRPTVIVEEFSTMMRGAVNLSEERRNLQRFGEILRNEPDIVIPAPYVELSSDQVLTMSLLTGAPLEDRAGVEATGWDPDALVRRSVDLYMEMIFRYGTYHADPHPGNFLIPDATHLGLIDFGDVGRLSSERRAQLEDIVIAIGIRDTEGLVDLIVELTTPPSTTDVPALRADVEAWLDRYSPSAVGELDMAALIGSGMELLHRHRLVLPADLAVLFRVLTHLQGLGRELGVQARIDELLQPYVASMIADRLSPERVAQRTARSARAWDRFLQSFPDDLRGLVQQARAGNLSLDVRLQDPHHAVDQLADALVTSASLLAGAQLIARRAGPTIGGVSVAGVLATAVGAVTWKRVLSRRGTGPTLLDRARTLARSQPSASR
jgi:ubiquinone biosynthesis protein